MVYDALKGIAVGYRTRHSHLHKNHLVLEPVTFGEVIVDHAAEEDPQLLYLKLAESLSHVNGDRHDLRKGANFQLEALTELTVEKMTIKNTMQLLAAKYKPKGVDWDNETLEHYMQRNGLAVEPATDTESSA
jgi:hypothetical protein